MTVRHIQAHLGEIYDINVSPDLISKITTRCMPKSWTGSPGRSTRSTR